MINREKLAEALGRLDSRDREVLDLSLCRRVSDTDLAEVFGETPEGVARIRASAIERLSKDLGTERGENLGDLLKDLLDESVWADAGSERGHRPLGVVGSDRSDAGGASGEAPRPTPPRPPDGSAPRPAAAGGVREGPVLDMLSGRDPGWREPGGRSRMHRLLAGAVVALAMLIPAGVVALTSGSSEGGAREEAPDGDDSRSFAPEPVAGGKPFPADPKSAYDYPVAQIDKTTALYDKPAGKVKVRIKPRTDWKSKRILSVVERRGEWMAVLAPELRNGEVGWIREGDAQSMSTVPWAVHVDLSKRQLEVRRGGNTVRKIKIGVGREDHSTPVGRYAVTDKLRVTDPGSPYGCCVVALTGHQTKLPAGWPGGDRLAVHATPDTSGLGKAVSLGCMRADPRDAKELMKELPLGAPVFVRQ